MRGADEVPREAGFCIERGFIPGSRLNREEVKSGVELPGMPNSQLNFSSFVTRNPAPSLLDRSRGIPSGRPEESGEGSIAFRRRVRVAAGLEGAELLMRERDGEEVSYEFIWEFPGTPNSLAAPFLKLALSLSPGWEEHFGDLQAAIVFWDQLLDSLRLRPGADGD